MKTNAKKRVLAWVLTALLAVTYMPQTAFAAAEDAETTGAAEPAAVTEDITVEATEVTETYNSASSISVLDGQVTVSDSKGTGVIESGVITITAPGVSLASEILEPNDVTITNNTAKPATVSFDYTAENYKTFSEEQAEGTYSTVLEAGESAQLSITGKQAFSKNTAVLKLSNFSLVHVADLSAVTFGYDEALGSITVDGAAVADGGTVETTYAAGISMTAVPADGTDFLGWINAETGKILSTELSATYKPIDDISVEAVFAGENSGSYYLVGNKFIISDFDAAMEKAGGMAYPVVALMNDVTLEKGDYTVPAGVTLLVPFDDEYTLYTTTPLGVNGQYSTPEIYRQLTLAEGANLYIDGEVSLSAKHNAANSNTRGSGAPFGDISFMEMEKNSSITVNDGGTLYVYGFITGEGEVTAKSGSTVYENFQIEDFRGGSCTTMMAAKEEGQEQQGVLPISQYYIQNIEVPLTLEYGSTEYCYASVYMLNTVMGSAVKFIGEDEAMFTLRDGSATKVYDGATDRLIVEGNGNMSLSSITVYLDTTPIVASMFELPINSNITVKVNDGNVDINQDVALLPGSEIVIEEGASCTLGDGVSVYVYDLDQWGNYCGASNVTMLPVNYAPGKEYERTEADLVDASICVNGTLDASSGYLYTTTSDSYEGGGANIYSTENGVIKLYSGEQVCTYQFIQDGIKGTYVPIYLLPANLVNDGGEYVQTIDIDPENPGTYTYSSGKWMCDHEVASTTVVSEATCDTDGITTVTCGADVPHTYNIVTPALGHSWESGYTIDKEPTCTEDGSKSIHCSNCDATKNVTAIAATGHSYSEYTTVTEPACETEGSETATCDVCGEEHTQAIPALGHDMVYEDEEPATCTEKGSMSSGACSRCDYTVEAGEIPALGHTFENNDSAYVDNGDATCEEEGTATAKCERCSVTDTKATPALGHVFTNYVDDDNATCTEAGTETAICDRDGCNETDSLATAALGHKWKSSYTVDKEAGCDTRGSKSIHCSVCDEIKEDSVKTIYATGHSYGSWTNVSASTCTVAGTKERVCDICGGKDTEELELADHKWEDTLTIDKEATCTENGYKSYHCSVCDEMDDVTVIPATGHDLGEYVDNGDATCTVAGTETAVCATCGEEDVQLTAALGHDWETAYTVDSPATCETPGVQSIHCTRCDETKDTLAIPVTAHSYTEYKNNTATCTEAGTAQSTCDYGCGTTETVETPALGHDYSNWKVLKEASCTAEGSQERICEVCGNKETEVIEQTSHNWETEYTVDVESACTVEGSESQHCADCDASRVPRPIEALGHDVIEHEGKAATCTESGWEAYETCSRCDYTSYKEIAAKGHTVVTDAAKAATCTETGLTEGSHCSVCNTVIKSQETVAAKGHTAVTDAAAAATCTTAGKTEGSHCSVCSTVIKAQETVAAKGHTAVTDAAVAATCTETGLTEGSHCSVCNAVITAQKEVAVLGHTWETVYTVDQAATMKAAGSRSYHCSVCDEINADSVVTIPQIKSAKVAALIYNGSSRAPIPAIYNYNGYKLKKGTDFTVVYKNAKATQVVTPKAVGKYTAVITFKGRYSGTVTKQFNINPKGTPIVKLTKNGKKQFTVKWQKHTVQVTGYQIRYSTKQNMNNAKIVTVKGTKAVTRTIKNLKAKKKYFVQVRTYKTVNGAKFVSAWSAKKTVKTK